MIKAKIVADSKNQQGNRITTMLVTFPRFILAELNTHRMLSKNSASSRAIPFKKMVESVQNNPFIPIAWQKEHKGMQGTEYWTIDDKVRIDIGNENEYREDIQPITEEFRIRWLEARDNAVNVARGLTNLGLTKQLANRLLEPFMWHTVLITSTEWENFFSLRCPQYKSHKGQTYRSWKDLIKDSTFLVAEELKLYTQIEKLENNKGQAEIHMMALAEAMWDAMNESTPKELKAGEWHIPFEDKIDLIDWLDTVNNDGHLDNDLDEQDRLFAIDKVKISTAMAARTSYTVVGDEKEFSYEKQIELHDRMVNQVPFHASPFEHAARCMSDDEYESYIRGKDKYTEPNKDIQGWCRNYRGFIQYREILENNK